MKSKILKGLIAMTIATTFSDAHAVNSPSLKSLLESEGTAMVPRVSTAMLIAQPENKALYDLLIQTPANTQEFKGKRIALVATDGVEEIELTGSQKFFKDRGATVHLISPKKPAYPAQFGVQIPDIRETHILTIRYMDFGGWVPFDKTIDAVNANDYDAVIIPGGTWNPDSLRADKNVLAFVSAMSAANKTTAAICHGPWVLGDAGLLKGKRATAWWSMAKDVSGAGGTFVDQPVVEDGNLITSRGPIDLAPFLAAVGKKVLK